jgi:hypothetical protein
MKTIICSLNVSCHVFRMYPSCLTGVAVCHFAVKCNSFFDPIWVLTLGTGLTQVFHLRGSAYFLIFQYKLFKLSTVGYFYKAPDFLIWVYKGDVAMWFPLSDEYDKELHCNFPSLTQLRSLRQSCEWHVHLFLFWPFQHILPCSDIFQKSRYR